MKPTRLWGIAVRSYDEFDLRVPEGIVAIVGPNGAGKSTLLATLDLALFAGRGELGRALRRGGGSETVEVGVEFEHRGETYRVRRRGGAKPTLDLERLEEIFDPDGAGFGNGARSLARESIAETAGEIERILGLSRATFRASALLMQGDGAAFTEATPAERKRILADVLALDAYDAFLEIATIERRRLETRLSEISATLAAVEQELDRREDVEEQLAERRARLEEAKTVEEALLEGARLAREASTKALERAGEYRALEQAATAARTRARDAQEALEEAKARIVADANRLERRDEIERTAGRLPLLETVERLERERDEKVARLEAVTAELRRHREGLADREEQARSYLEPLAAVERALESPAASCDACGQALAGEALETWVARQRENRDAIRIQLANAEGLVAQKREAVEKIAGGAGEAKADAEKAERELIEARARAGIATEARPLVALLLESRSAATELAALEEVARNRDERLRSIEAGETTLSELRIDLLDADVAVTNFGEIPDVAAAQNEVERAQKAARDYQAVVALLERQLGQAEAIRDRLDDLDRRRATVLAARAAVERDLAIVRVLERAYGRDGIPALLLENRAIPQIEAEASRIVAELGRPFRFELRTQRALKTGGVAEALDVFVLTPSGEALYEDFSGGEKTRLNLALRIALARLLARSRGAEVRILAIDEPEFLDADGFERLAAVLRGLTDEFDTILVISHDPDLRDAFDSAIVVAGDGDSPSTLEILA